MITAQIQTAAYLFAGILFILSLGGLSSQESAKRGVLYGIIGMAIAILSTVLGADVNGHIYIIVAIAIASVIGIVVARKVEMTSSTHFCWVLPTARRSVAWRLWSAHCRTRCSPDSCSKPMAPRSILRVGC